MLKPIKNVLKKSLIPSVIGLSLLPTAAQATYGSYSDWKLSSNAGTYAPVVHGEDIQFNACGTTISNKNNPSQSYSICALPSVSQFRLHWYRYEPTLGVRYISSFVGVNAAAGLSPIFATGLGTYFPVESANYLIGLFVNTEANAVIGLPDGGTANLGTGTLSSFKWSAWTSVIAPAAVPEPLGLFLLLPGLALIAKRQRRQTRKSHVV